MSTEDANTQEYDDESPWRDEDILRELYHDEQLTQREIADKLGCEDPTISEWMSRLDIQTRTDSEAHRLSIDYTDPWHDEEKLRELYCEKQWSAMKIADEFECRVSTIIDWLDRFGIEQRSIGEALKIHWRNDPTVPLYVMDNGYEEFFTTYDTKEYRCLHHRLLAVAEYGFDTVSEMNIHHKNSIPWDNRPDNLQPVTPEDHRKIHAEERRSETDTTTFIESDTLRHLYHENGLSAAEIGELHGMSEDMVFYWMRHHNLPRR